MKLFILSLLICLSSCSPKSPYAGVEENAEVRIELAPTASFDGGLRRNSQEGYVLKVSKGGILLYRSGTVPASTQTFIPWSSVISVRIITPAPHESWFEKIWDWFKEEWDGVKGLFWIG
jgi:hypothetical protein